MNTIKPDNRANNFDFLRLLFASLVVFSHAFALTDTSPEILSKYSYGQLSFGGLAVDVFFYYKWILNYQQFKTKQVNKELPMETLFKTFPGFIFHVNLLLYRYQYRLYRKQYL